MNWDDPPNATPLADIAAASRVADKFSVPIAEGRSEIQAQGFTERTGFWELHAIGKTPLWQGIFHSDLPLPVGETITLGIENENVRICLIVQIVRKCGKRWEHLVR